MHVERMNKVRDTCRVMYVVECRIKLGIHVGLCMR